MGGGKDRKRGLSRRDFIKVVGAGGGGLLASGAVPVAAQDKPGARVLGPDKVPCTLKVNGREHALHFEPRTTLLNALRNKLDLTGPKEVCDRGACGACTVWLDGRPVNSCMMLALDAEGGDITTIEGLARGDKLNPVQAAFVEKDALQCGYCTPGFVMSMAACLRDRPKATLDEVKQGCAGNLCRCSAYTQIFEAAQAVVRGDTFDTNVSKLSGDALREHLEKEGVPRLDAPAKVKGEARYTSDQKPPRLLHARTLNSMFAKASVEGEPDLEAARKVPGVQHVEVINRNPGIGAPVALAAADDPQAADEALAALKIRLRPEPAGRDVDKIFRDNLKADPAKEGLTYFIQTVQHCPLEGHGCMAHWQEPVALFQESTQGIHAARGAMAQALRMEPGKLRAVVEHVGGGFGCKISPWSDAPRAMRLSKDLGVPVLYMENRETVLANGGGRNLAIVADGRQVRLGLQGYGTMPALRAPGTPQARFVADLRLDWEAEQAGVDPLDYRKEKDAAHAEWYDQGAKAIGWERRQKKPGSAAGPVKRGLGIGYGKFQSGEGVDFAEVEVDVEIGVVRVKKMVVVFGGGWINRRGAISQITGGTIMGLSWCMFEERMMDRAVGGMMNPNLEFYKVAGPVDIPEIQVILRGSHGNAGGIGEAPVCAVAGAIGNAIHNATGAWVTRQPFVPRNVLAALKAR